jgi:hypothetical protein
MNYYFDEFLAMIDAYNDMHDIDKIKEVYADELPD